MLDSFARPLRMLALALAAVLVFQVARLVSRGDPLGHLRIPELPTLAASTNAPATNAIAGTNAAPAPTNVASAGTNTAGTNAAAATNSAHAANQTNTAVSTNLAATTNKLATNAVSGTNVVKASNATNKNPSAGTNSAASPTNTLAQSEHRPRGGRARGMEGMMPGGPPPHIDLPPAVQSRVDKIIESEILGPVMRPQPMALLGIADEDAFLRLTNGQTGAVKVGHDFGGIKLLRIGMNRVLIEEGGEKKEMTLFGGMGGESLMPKTNDASTNSPAQTNTVLAAKPKETL
jgi:hypothetical protein